MEGHIQQQTDRIATLESQLGPLASLKVIADNLTKQVKLDKEEILSLGTQLSQAKAMVTSVIGDKDKVDQHIIKLEIEMKQDKEIIRNLQNEMNLLEAAQESSKKRIKELESSLAAIKKDRTMLSFGKTEFGTQSKTPESPDDH